MPNKQLYNIKFDRDCTYIVRYIKHTPREHTMDSSMNNTVRHISYEQWCEAAIKLENSPDTNEVEVSIPRLRWTWRVVRTDVKGIFLKNTYFDGKIITSSSMNVLVECHHMRTRIPADAA